jgi:NAD(P)-dependent dehydrogenase (short-subunit alcohol dehydrogenase family)
MQGVWRTCQWSEVATEWTKRGAKKVVCLFRDGDDGHLHLVACTSHAEPVSLVNSHREYPWLTSPCSAEKVKELIEKQEGGKCHIVEVDLMKHEDCERTVKEHMDKFGKLSVLVNNVSFFLPCRSLGWRPWQASKQIMVEKVEDMDLKDVESTFQSNIVAMIAMAKYAVPHMKRGSAIVNSTSVTAFKGTFECYRSHYIADIPYRQSRYAWLLMHEGSHCHFYPK